MAFGIDDAIAAGLRLIDKFVPDPQAKIDAKLQLTSLFNQFSASMNEVNKAEIEAAKTLKGFRGFISQWRSLLGTTLAFGFLYQFVLYHFTISILLAIDEHYPVEKLPVIDWKVFGTLLMGMLGISSGS